MPRIDKSKDMIPYVICTSQGKVRIIGKYRRDLETNNWHYWEKNDGIVIHFRKEHIIYVEGGKVEDVVLSKKGIEK